MYNTSFINTRNRATCCYFCVDNSYNSNIEPMVDKRKTNIPFFMSVLMWLIALDEVKFNNNGTKHNQSMQANEYY